MKYIDYSNLYFQIAVGTSLFLMASAIILSKIKQSTHPLQIFKVICFALSVILTISTLLFYFNCFWGVASIFLTTFLYLIISKTRNAVIIGEDGGATDHSFPSIIIIIGGIMYFIFSKYVDLKIAQNKNIHLFDISLFLLFFCSILCLTSWIASILMKRIGLEAKFEQKNDKGQKLTEERIVNYIMEGEVKLALIDLKRISVEKNKHNIEKASILLMSNLTEIENRYNLNHLSLEELRIEKTKISDKILNLLKGL